MALAHLSTELFTEIDQLLHAELFPKNILHLLGSHLEQWLQNILALYETTSNPVIKGDVEDGAVIKGQVYIGKDTIVESGAYISGPAFIGESSQIRHGAYIRGNVYVGRKCTIGHTSEAKGACFLDGAKASHFAYVGDSVLGQNVNLGAGTKLANLQFNNKEVHFLDPQTHHKTASGLRKFGSILGDRAQTGCNAVLSPGSLLLPDTAVFPCKHFHGTLRTGFAK